MVSIDRGQPLGFYDSCADGLSCTGYFIPQHEPIHKDPKVREYLKIEEIELIIEISRDCPFKS